MTTTTTQTNYRGEPFVGTARSGYEVLTLGFAVFNGHVNNANLRARALMSVIAPRFLEEVEQIEREGNGIMAIFNQPDTSATVMYASLVTAFVNEKAEIDR